MGVAKLWDVLQDAKAEVTLKEIRGLTLAVDLATWVCESEGVKPMKSYVVKPYLRNLFFRVSGVLKADVNLVFVLDGKPPELKLETIARRLASSSGSPKKTSSGVRSRLNSKFKECCVLLDSLGVPWIKAESEAEALCASLDRAGLVDGIITNDGDAFLYGARTVYRNFSVEKNAIIERCSMDEIESKLNLNQRDLIALGLLLGCDYCPKGVPGIGVAQAVKLLESFEERDALDVFRRWKQTGEIVNRCENSTKPIHCSICGHEGTKREHLDIGCKSCGNSCSQATSNSKKSLQVVHCRCQWHLLEQRRKKQTLEEKIKIAALKESSFPDEAIIKEFLKKQRYLCPTKMNPVDPATDQTLRARFTIKSPTLDIACRDLERHLKWETSYALSKVLPLLTHHLLNTSNVQNEDKNAQVSFDSILRSRVKDHVQSLEVRWILLDSTSSLSSEELVTIEAEEDMKKAFPDRVTEFYERIKREKEEKKKAKVEVKKAERKKLKDSARKVESAQSTKMTDFFKVKKQKDVVMLPQRPDNPTQNKSLHTADASADHGKTNMAKLEISLKSLSINKSRLDCDSVQIVPKKSIAGVKGPGKPSYLQATSNQSCSAASSPGSKTVKGPIIVFSSDSDSDDGATQARYDAKKKHIPGCMRNVSPDSASNKCSISPGGAYGIGSEITFSSELNFSLGCSLLQTTDADHKEYFPPCNGEANHLSIDKRNRVNVTQSKKPFPLIVDGSNPVHCENPSEVLACDTPVKTVLSPPDNEISDSPVFMTLMERLKHRQKQ